MLVLSRKLGETIVINNNIEVTIVEIDRGKIRLGIKADKSIPVHRLEILKAIQAEQARTKSAATAG